MSLRWKLILAIVSPLVLITCVVMGLTLSRIYAFAASGIQQRSLRELDLYASRIGASFETLAQVARSTASFAAVQRDLAPREAYDLLAANVEQHAMIYGSALAFEPGALRNQSEPFAPYVHGDGEYLKVADLARAAPDWRDDGAAEWYAPVRRSRTPRWTEAYFNEHAGGQPMTTYSAPVIRDEDVVGVATIDVLLEVLQQEAMRELGGQNFAILGHSGRFLAHYNPATVMNATLQTQAALLGNDDYLDIVDDILGGASGIGEVDNFLINGEIVPGSTWVLYVPITQTGWFLVAFVPEAVSTAELRAYLVGGTMGLVLTVVLAFIGVWIVSTRMTQPIRELSRAVSNVARGKLDTPIETPRSLDELGRLAIGFNRMLKNLKKHIEQEGRESAARQMVEQELAVARETQKSLLPRDFPPFPEHREFELHAVNQTAQQVGGDFFDFFKVGPRNLMFVVADVSGKGVSAALVMAVTHTIIRNLAKTGRSPAEILAETNTLLIDSQRRSAFVTVFLGNYNTATGAIVYANAGHTPPFRITRDGQVRECGEATGTIVGMLENEKYHDAEITLKQGETLVLYTDGFSEARSPSGDFYGQGRIRQFLEEHAGLGPRALCETAVAEICHYQGENLSDDITILALRRTHGRISLFLNDLKTTRPGGAR